jgi:hypothetical protein
MSDDREKHVFRSAVPSHAPYPDDLDVYVRFAALLA